MINQKLGRMFNIADFRGCGNITFTAEFQNECWSVVLTCLHDHYNGTSDMPADLETAFAKLLREFQDKHDNLPNSDD